MITHKSDVWSGCVTMMNVLVGKGANVDSRIQVSTTSTCTYVATYVCMATGYSVINLLRSATF